MTTRSTVECWLVRSASDRQKRAGYAQPSHSSIYLWRLRLAEAQSSMVHACISVFNSKRGKAQIIKLSGAANLTAPMPCSLPVGGAGSCKSVKAWDSPAAWLTGLDDGKHVGDGHVILAGVQEQTEAEA